MGKKKSIIGQALTVTLTMIVWKELKVYKGGMNTLKMRAEFQIVGINCMSCIYF